MNYQVTIPLRYLLAARLFAAKFDVRFYLNGVAIKDGYIVGTNGTIIGAIRYDTIEPNFPEIIIPNDSIDIYAKKAKRGPQEVTITWDDGIYRGTLTNGAAVEQFIGIDGTYPQFQKVLPKHTRPSGHPQFQATLLLQFEKAAAELGAKGIKRAYVIPDGNEGNARVILPGHPEFHGAISPLSYSDVEAAIEEIEEYQSNLE